jgi:nitrilase
MARLIWGSGDGSTLPAIETGFGRTGAVICRENYMPLLRAAMYAKGVQLYCAPTVDDRETWLPTLRHIALEGRCYVLSACQFVRSSTEAGNINGGSAIVGPMGEVLAGPLSGGEGILSASIDLDVVGHYARPDVFHLNVNESVLKSVQFGGEAERPEA